MSNHRTPMLIESIAITTMAFVVGTGFLPSNGRWPTTQLPVRYCLTPNATNTAVTANDQRAAVVSAIGQWRTAGAGGGLSCTSYNAVAQTTGCSAVRARDGTNNIFWTRNWTNPAQAIGVTWSNYGAGNCGSVNDSLGMAHTMACTVDADIEFNDVNFRWTTAGGGTDIASIAVHEYGHFLGLGHCNVNTTCQRGTGVMYAAYGGGMVRVPFNDDVRGACALYPGTPGGVGWPCSSATACTSGICLSPGGYCTQTCGTCQPGYSCRESPMSPGQMVCQRDDGLNRGLCEVCQGGLPNACANGGVCLGRLPEPQGGRCTVPCGAGGSCPAQYTCVQVSIGGMTQQHCVPRSRDCTNLGATPTELQLGQTCNGNPPCASGLTCIGICSQRCTGTGPSNCPTGYSCASFNFMTGPESFCAPPVNEGESCTGIHACTVGPCLRLASGGGNATCYQSCAGNPNGCNNAQTCNTYMLSGAAGTVSICEPPGVPPNAPDAGVSSDTGIDPGCACKLTSGCNAGCACDPECPGGPDSGTTTQNDAGGPSGDGSGTRPDSGIPGLCTCDTMTHCPQGCVCTCDVTNACDPNCPCDPECNSGNGRDSSGCSCVAVPAAISSIGAAPPAAPNRSGRRASEAALAVFALFALGIGLLGTRHFMR